MKELIGCFLIAALIFVLLSFLISIFFAITEAVGSFIFMILGVEYPSFSIWLLLIFGSLSVVFFIASKESYRDYVVKLKVYKMFQKILGD